ncbi:hypothetical protein Tco_0978338, partial [Tanacetum coccineum]
MLERSTGIARVTKATSGQEAITKEQQSPQKVRSISLFRRAAVSSGSKEQQSPQEVRTSGLLRRRLVHNQYLEHGDNLESEDQLRAKGDALISKGPAAESHS